MLNLIYKLSSELRRSSSKIFPVFCFSNKFVAIILDACLIEVIDYNRKDSKVSTIVVNLVII